MTVKEYNKCVDDFADSVYRFIRADLRDDARAHDIVQDCYEKLWKNVTQVNFTVAKSWLFSSAYNLMIDIIRKEKKTVNVDVYCESDILSDEQYSDMNELLHEALEKLPENQRTPLLLRDYEGYSYKEIEEITGMSESLVKINIYRGRLAMRKLIGSMETVL